jgi:hypothetical protein
LPGCQCQPGVIAVPLACFLICNLKHSVTHCIPHFKAGDASCCSKSPSSAGFRAFPPTQCKRS